MSIKLSGDIYFRNVSASVADPVQTSMIMYEKINEFLSSVGLKDRYGPIKYLIVKKTENDSSTYVAFLSLEDSSKHYELKENLANFHFDNKKLIAKVNRDATDQKSQRKNKKVFEAELAKYNNLKIEKLTNPKKRKHVDSSLEESDLRPKCSKTSTNDEESCDSFSSVKEETNVQLIAVSNLQTSHDKQITSDLDN